MNRAAAFALVAAGAAFGAVAGAMTLKQTKGPRRMKQQPYAAIGAGLLATGTAAVLYTKPTCPPCSDGTVPTPTSVGLGGYSAAVAASAIVGGVAGAMAVGKNPGARMKQQIYAPIGAAVLGAGAAAIFLPDPTDCPACPAPPPISAPTPTPVPAPLPATPTRTPPEVAADQSPPPR